MADKDKTAASTPPTPLSPREKLVAIAMKKGGFADDDKDASALLTMFAQYRDALREMGVRDFDSAAVYLTLHHVG